jgi:hypothetical protein
MTIDETSTSTDVVSEPVTGQRTRRVAEVLRSKRLPVAATLVAVGSAVLVLVRRRRSAKTARNRWRPAFLSR